MEHFSKWKSCTILLVPVRSLVNISCPLNVVVLTSKLGSMYGSSVMCFYGKGLRINTYTYLMLISRSIKFQSELSGGGIIWPHMQCSNTAEEATQKIADCATNQLDWSKFQAKTWYIHFRCESDNFLAKIKKRSLSMTLLQCFNSGIRKGRPHS